LAEKNRDLNQSREKLEQMEDAKQRLKNELENIKITLNKKDNEIQRYIKKKKIQKDLFIFELFSLKEESERIRFNCEQEVYNTRLQVKEIIVC
jgi:hypothetical protein